MSDETITGHVIGGPADLTWDGSVLTADLGLGDTVLQVEELADFDEDAAKHDARIIVGIELDSDGKPDTSTGTALAYETYDDAAGTLTLAAASTVTASTGDRVYIEDPVTGQPVGEAEVLVDIDDGDSTGDALTATIDAAQLGAIGDADLTELAVELEEDEDGQLVVRRFLGLDQRVGGGKFMQDELTVTELGDQLLALTYVPSANSEHLYWEGLYQPGGEWSRTGRAVTIPDPDGLLAVDDLLVMEYAYTDPTVRAAEAVSIRGSDSAAASSPVTSLSIPIGSPSEGDTILLATSRATAPGGWTLVGDAVTSGTHLRVYAKESDGTETAVLISGSSDVLAGITVVVNATDLAVGTGSEDPHLSTTFECPSVSGTPLVSFALFDGPGWPPDEHITGVDTTMLENLKAQSGGLYGLAAAADRATFTSTAGSVSSYWLGVTVAVV